MTSPESFRFLYFQINIYLVVASGSFCENIMKVTRGIFEK